MTLASRVWNQRGELVLEGEMRFLLRLKQPRTEEAADAAA